MRARVVAISRRALGKTTGGGWRGWIYFVLLLSSIRPVAAQVTLSGTVRDSLTRQPLPFASVFLANTTRGATTDAQGHYALPNVPAGTYELSATYLGYQLRQRPVLLGPRALVVDIAVLPAAHQLAEVVVRPNPNRAADYQRFLELFLGTSTRARQCRVRDPDAVRVDYDAQQRLLTASVPHALEVDNLALGYRLTFYDLNFRADFTGQNLVTTTLSHLVFQPLPGGAARQRRWATNRQRAYLGSQLHFLRCVYAEAAPAAGFEVQRLRRVPNRRRTAADSLLRARQAELGTAFQQTSVPDSVWHLLKQPRELTFLYAPLLPAPAYRQAAEGRVWLRYPDLLAITYLRAKPDANYHQLSLTLIPGREQASILHLTQGPAVELTPQGYPVDPLALLAEGYWAFEQMGDLLPTDYEPPLVSPEYQR